MARGDVRREPGRDRHRCHQADRSDERADHLCCDNLAAHESSEWRLRELEEDQQRERRAGVGERERVNDRTRRDPARRACLPGTVWKRVRPGSASLSSQTADAWVTATSSIAPKAPITMPASRRPPRSISTPTACTT